MDRKLNIEIKVGFFVLFAIMALSYMVFQISGSSLMNKNGYTIKAIFGFVSGVEPKSPVRLAGVSVGEVNNIRIYYNEEKNQVEVELSLVIRRDIHIPRNSIAYISTLGIMGEKYVEFVPGTKASGVLKSGDVIRGKDPVSMEKLTEVLMDVVADKQVKDSFVATLNNLNDTSASLKNITLSMESILKNVESGQGTIGKLLSSDKIYNDLEYFVDDIKNHPWKLFVKTKEKNKK